MTCLNRTSRLILGLICVFNLTLCAQDNPPTKEYSTVIIFRTFDIFSFDRSYKLYANDSLLGRIRTHDVIVLETYDNGVTFQAATKAPSLNAGKRTNHQKRKYIKYPTSLKPGHVYFIKCGYLTQSLFDLPRQPTIKLLDQEGIRKHLRKRFLRKKISAYLYEGWLAETDLKKLTLKK